VHHYNITVLSHAQIWHALNQGSQTRGPRAACGPQRPFVPPVMLFGNLQIINIHVAKCLEKGCRDIIQSKLNDTQCGFRPGRSTATFLLSFSFAKQMSFTLSSSKFLSNLGSMLKTSSQLCRPRESIRPGSLWKALVSVAYGRCWRPPVTGRQVTVLLLRNLCPCRES